MSKKVCCVIGCPTQNTSGEPLYLFPKKTTQRYERWMTLFPYSFLICAATDNFICRRHFTADSFDDKQRLKLSADPTVHIDISYAHNQILEMFLTKVMYEWSIRSNDTNADSIIKKAYEVKHLLGLQAFIANSTWVASFLRLRNLNADNKLRHGTGTSEHLINIIKELRRLVPSNFVLPVDSMEAIEENTQTDVKMETDTEDGSDDGMKTAEEPETYEDALNLLKPLELYINGINNNDAMARLREIESSIKESIANGEK